MIWAKVNSGIFQYSRAYHSADNGPSIKKAHLKIILRGRALRVSSLKNIPTAPATQKPKSITSGIATSADRHAITISAEAKESFCLAKLSCEVTNVSCGGSSRLCTPLAAGI